MKNERCLPIYAIQYKDIVHHFHLKARNQVKKRKMNTNHKAMEKEKKMKKNQRDKGGRKKKK